jgi:hypothetical protein
VTRTEAKEARMQDSAMRPLSPRRQIIAAWSLKIALAVIFLLAAAAKLAGLQ